MSTPGSLPSQPTLHIPRGIHHPGEPRFGGAEAECIAAMLKADVRNAYVCCGVRVGWGARGAGIHQAVAICCSIDFWARAPSRASIRASQRCRSGLPAWLYLESIACCQARSSSPSRANPSAVARCAGPRNPARLPVYSATACPTAPRSCASEPRIVRMAGEKRSSMAMRPTTRSRRSSRLTLVGGSRNTATP